MGPTVRLGVDGSQAIPGRGAPQPIMDNPDKEVESLNLGVSPIQHFHYQGRGNPIRHPKFGDASNHPPGVIKTLELVHRDLTVYPKSRSWR